MFPLRSSRRRKIILGNTEVTEFTEIEARHSVFSVFRFHCPPRALFAAKALLCALILPRRPPRSHQARNSWPSPPTSRG